VTMRALIIAAVFVGVSGPALAAVVKSQQAVASAHGIHTAPSAPAASSARPIRPILGR
jgi:hypothetical protein